MKRTIFLLSLLLISSMVLSSCTGEVNSNKSKVFEPVELFPEPARPAGQKDALEMRCEPIDTVHIGVIGLGMRGYGAIHRLSFLKTAKISAICELSQTKIDRALKLLEDRNYPKPDVYLGENAWKEMCQRDDIDLVYIITNWGNHTPMALYAMEHGKHAVSEVPSSITIDECWQLVNEVEKTRKHFMMLENCVYDYFEMATYRMAEEGVFGEIVHTEGAYIHDLRALNFNTTEDFGGYWKMWRLKENEKRNGNLYPTHGFGPICHIMNIHRGDRMEYVTSLSSNQFGMTAYAKEKFGEDSEFAKREYKRGDMNTSIIRTANGKTMMIQQDVTSPRPYDRRHLISGTKGYACKYPIKQIAIEGRHRHGHHLDALPEDEMEDMLKKYEHPIVTEIGKEAKKVGGHGGMDFIMDYRLIYCLNNGLPLDQDVYDAAEWSALSELSEKSVENHGMPIKYPDFTRGAWKKLKKVTYYHK